MKHAISDDIHTIRTTKPLIHNITNFVVMNTTANALLALGASPIMAHAVEELAELLSIAQALVINIGTLDSHWINSFEKAVLIAADKNIPIVIDPVGAGASTLRTHTALHLLHLAKITAIRGNASEIMALNQFCANTKGVDSAHESHDAVTAAKNLSKKFNCVVVVSGKIDYCIESDTVISVDHGSEMMTRVTGMGCTATALMGAFLAVNKNSLEACVNAMTCMGICGEMAAKNSKGPGSFLPEFLDALSVETRFIASHEREARVKCDIASHEAQ